MKRNLDGPCSDTIQPRGVKMDGVLASPSTRRYEAGQYYRRQPWRGQQEGLYTQGKGRVEHASCQVKIYYCILELRENRGQTELPLRPGRHSRRVTMRIP